MSSARSSRSARPSVTTSVCITADTGVSLTAAREVADEPVAVVVKQYPAGKLLQELAELLDYTWSRRTTDPRPPPPADGRRAEAGQDGYAEAVGVDPAEGSVELVDAW